MTDRDHKPPMTPDSVIGRPLDRVDGPHKVTGAAVYAYEHRPEGRTAYGVVLGAPAARGHIVSLYTADAERAPGVLYVMTHRNAPQQAPFGPPVTPTVPEVFTRARPVLVGDEVRYYDEPIALVVAETFEAARAATRLIRVRIKTEDGAFDLKGERASAYAPARTNAGFTTDSAIGSFEEAFAAAPVQLDAEYTTPYQHHNPMEPHATTAVWSGDDLTVYTSAQTLNNFKEGLAATLRLSPERVRVVSPYVGGGFGAKLIIHADTVLAAMAARRLQRPVKVALTRQQMFANAGYRAEMVQRVRLGADAQGRLTAIGHDVWSSTARIEEFCEQTAVFTRSLYAAPNRLTRHRLVAVDLNRGEWMRSPGEAPGMLAMECAMDELAERLTMDPIELRIRNEPKVDPERHVPFSTRHLVNCMQEGARLIGWHRRGPPGQTREGRHLIGMGMAAAIRPNYLGASQARLTIAPTGEVTAFLDMTDIGTGTYTILTQVIADSLALPPAGIRVQLGDSRYPRTAGSGGSWGAASSGTAVLRACTALKDRIAAAAVAHPRSPLYGADITRLRWEAGRLTAGDRSAPLAAILTQVAPAGLEAEGAAEAGASLDSYRSYSQHAYGAHFARVAVDMDTGEIRMRQMLAVVDAGRILNPKTARSQIIGGMTWGLGAALMEKSELDPRFGAFINHDLAEYHLPTNADVAEMDVVFLETPDGKANPLAIKGLGELGVCGAGAAVANAIYNATGVRVRDYPITLDKLLSIKPS